MTDVVSNVAATATVVDGAALSITVPKPAGSDEASFLATANTSAHSANFLGVSLVAFMEMAMYAGALGVYDANYTIADTANASQYL